MSEIAAGRALIAWVMSVAALSTESSRRCAWPSAASAAWMALTSAAWLSPGLLTKPRAAVMFWSANASRSLAAPTLPATDARAASANWPCNPVKVCCAGSMRAVRPTICCVRASSRVGALITRSRS